MATATATKEEEKKTRNRAPSPFDPEARITISVHEDVDDNGQFSVASVAGRLQEIYTDSGYAVRLVSRKRASAKTPGIPSAMLYVAPKDFKFPESAERGLRLDSETANEIKAAAAVLGIDGNDKDALVKMLRSLAQTTTKSARK